MQSSLLNSASDAIMVLLRSYNKMKQKSSVNVMLPDVKSGDNYPRSLFYYSNKLYTSDAVIWPTKLRK